jgi:RNA polymerase sigma-70 factor (ECF subfamily)
MEKTMEKPIFHGNRIFATKDYEFLKNFNVKKKEFESFVNLYKNELYTFLLLMSGDKQLSYDISRDIFVKTYYRISKSENAEMFKLWFYKYMYKRTLKIVDEFDEVYEDDSHTGDEYEDLEGKDFVDEPNETQTFTGESVILYQALSTLDIESRAILIMKDIIKENSEFISNVLDLTEGTVRLRLSMARFKFSTQIAKLTN